jgi:hypothetical protein
MMYGVGWKCVNKLKFTGLLFRGFQVQRFY